MLFAVMPGGEIVREAASGWLPILLDAAVKGMVVLALAGVAVLLMRRASAAARHLVWSLAIVSLPALPILSAVAPKWQVLPDWMAMPAEVVGQFPSVNHAEPIVPQGELPRVHPREVSPWPVESAPGNPLASRVVEEANVEQAADPASLLSGQAIDPAATPPEPSRLRSFQTWGMAAWLGGAALVLLPLGLGTWSLWRLQRSADRITVGPWTLRLRRLAAEMGVRRRVVLLRSNRRSMPMHWGIVRPKLLLPAVADEWPEERRRVVLLHELAHIRRWDCLTQLITQVACALYWFNPLVWVALRRVHLEREAACDDLILQAGHKPSDYAEHLLQIVSGLQSNVFAAYSAIAMARRSRLEGRLRAILDPKRNRRRLTRAAVLVAVALLVGVMVPVAMMRAADSQEETRDEQVVKEEAATADGSATEANQGDRSQVASREETMPALKLRLVASGKTEYQARTALPLKLELQNAGDKPVPYGQLAWYADPEASDETGRRLVARTPLALGPWTTRTGSLEPGGVIEWTEWFDRFRFAKPLQPGSTVQVRYRLTARGQGPKGPRGTEPSIEVFSNPITIKVRDSHPSPLDSEQDVPDRWTESLDLVYREDMGLAGWRLMHVEGNGLVRLVRPAFGTEDAVVPWGRYQVQLPPEHLDRLVRLLREARIWELGKLPAPTRPSSPDEGGIGLSFACGGVSLVREFPNHVVQEQPGLLALQKEMHRFMAVVVAEAKQPETPKRTGNTKLEGRPPRRVFLGLDLTDAPQETEAAKLPDLFEERPPGSKSWKFPRQGVVLVYNKPDGMVMHVPKKNIFYVQHDPLGSSTLHYYGPFEGDPRRVMNLESESPPTGPDAPQETEAAKRPDGDKEAIRDVDVRYAEAAAAVAKAEYLAALEANNKVPGTFPQAEVQRLSEAWQRAQLNLVEPGVRFGIWADKLIWKADEVPQLKADVSHRGTRELQRWGPYELEVDGRWYAESSVDKERARTFDPQAFRPQTDYRNIQFILDERWRTKGSGDPLKLGPGRHRMRVALDTKPAERAADEPIRLLSNLSEIHVLIPGQEISDQQWLELAAGGTPGSKYTAQRVADMHRVENEWGLPAVELAKRYAMRAIQLAQTAPDPVLLEDAVEQALALDQDPQTEAQLYVYLGDAHWRQTTKYSPAIWGRQRRIAAEAYLTGLKRLLRQDLPAELPELPTVEAGVVDGPPEVVEAFRRKNAEQMEARRRAERIRRLVQLRQTLTGQVVQMYAREPDAWDELHKLVVKHLGSEAAAGQIVEGAKATRGDFKAPVPAVKVPAEPVEPAAERDG